MANKNTFTITVKIEEVIKGYIERQLEVILATFIDHLRAEGLQITDIRSLNDENAIYNAIQSYIKEFTKSEYKTGMDNTECGSIDCKDCAGK